MPQYANFENKATAARNRIQERRAPLMEQLEPLGRRTGPVPSERRIGRDYTLQMKDALAEAGLSDNPGPWLQAALGFAGATGQQDAMNQQMFDRASRESMTKRQSDSALRQALMNSIGQYGTAELGAMSGIDRSEMIGLSDLMSKEMQLEAQQTSDDQQMMQQQGIPALMQMTSPEQPTDQSISTLLALEMMPGDLERRGVAVMPDRREALQAVVNDPRISGEARLDAARRLDRMGPAQPTLSDQLREFIKMIRNSEAGGVPLVAPTGGPRMMQK